MKIKIKSWYELDSSRSLIFDDGSHGNTENLPPVLHQQSKTSSNQPLGPAKQPLQTSGLQAVHSETAAAASKLPQAGQPTSLHHGAHGTGPQLNSVGKLEPRQAGPHSNQSLNSSRTPNSFHNSSQAMSGESFNKVGN